MVGSRGPAISALRKRRIERLRREIALLEQMDSRLWRRALFDATVAVAFIALLLTLTALKLQYFSYHPLAIVTASIGIAALIWWLGRYALWIPVILVALLLAILFEGGDLGGLDFGGDDEKADKPERRRKLGAALIRRRAALAKLEARP